MAVSCGGRDVPGDGIDAAAEGHQLYLLSVAKLSDRCHVFVNHDTKKATRENDINKRKKIVVLGFIFYCKSQ